MLSPTLNIYFGDNLEVLRSLGDGTVDLIYVDPPFNTGKRQTMTQIRAERDAGGDRIGFQGNAYRTAVIGKRSYLDVFDDYLDFIGPRLEEAYRLLRPEGSIFVHLDYREVHYVKVLMDSIFGRDAFLNEIIWAYDYGARSKSRWPAKHDNILWYARNPAKYTFNFDAMDRIPYMAPGLVGPEKAERGKTPTDTWWHTIVPTNGKERTGYPNQKPMGILRRIIKVHSNPGDVVMDFFAGSGTTGDAALELGRSAILIDDHREALEVMEQRLARWQPVYHCWEPTATAHAQLSL
jgi:site-specific DNA-methyltransferase (adenine-specific)